MAVTGSDPDLRGPAAPEEAGEVAAGLRKVREALRDPERVWHYFGIPVITALSLTALWFYVDAQELSSREMRTLNAPFLRARAMEHVELSLIVTLVVVAIAVPLGIMLTRPWAKQATPLFIGIANAGQAIPSIGVLVLLAIILAPGPRTVIMAVVLYCILPILRNTMVGIEQVDPDLIEAGRGMGMTKRAVLWRIEMPLAVPVVLAGVRTALILAVGTITLGALVGGGTLGRVINAGIIGFSNPVLITGAVLVAALALMIDWVAGIGEDVLRPRGL